MNNEYQKSYQPAEVENKWYKFWMDNDYFKPKESESGKTYSILMPPPNVTGILHFGHVLNQTLQDIYSRWKRMNGYEVCWFPGMDHAGIATQTKVEAALRQDNLSRYDLGREKFIEAVWQWKEKYGGIILKQLQKLGISCDWSRTLFTMDDSASNAVKEVFIKLYDEGLIYKGQRIINWSPDAQTALSDEEVEFKEVKEYLYTFKYYFEDGSNYLKVATVRPETIFGDIAVAVNPDDDRYKEYIGQTVIVPLVGRKVKIIADNYADPKFGTGCVKITPAHDPNDFEVGNRHNLEMINTINPDGSMNELAGDFNGLDRFEARKQILKKLEELDLIDKKEDYTHNVGFSQRGGEPVEPYLSDQWFVKMKPLAEKSLDVVKNSQINFYPEHWSKTYEHWMNNIRDWCISRQLWWGHRIPVYYAEDGRHTAANDENEARQKLGLPNNAKLKQDDDVLDTWFSSWLWPLTTMRWMADENAETTEDMNKFLPTDLLVTAPDIIFFWVARMIMATKHFKDELPFKDVYFTSTIRDGKGRKLSKSLGNSPDPLNIIDKYGADAIRFTIIYLSPLGQDVRMDVNVDEQDIPSMEIGRNFANKVWNAGRFLMMKQEIAEVAGTCPSNEGRSLKPEEMSTADKWILSRYHSANKILNKYLEDYKVTEYSKLLYDFIWRDFCDWYIEVVKVQLNDSESPSYKQALLRHALGIFEGIIKLLHPVMPFITEEIWHLICERKDNSSISVELLDTPDHSLISNDIEGKFSHLQMIVEEIRSLRSQTSIPPSKKLPVTIIAKDEAMLSVITEQSSTIASLARCSQIDASKDGEKPNTALASVVREVEVCVDIGGEIDLDKEKERLNKEIKRLEGNIKGSEKKLSNEKFLNNAPEKVVSYEKEKLESMQQSLEKVKENLKNLS